VRGSLSVARPGSRLRVELLAKPAALGRKGRTQIRVGSATKSTAAGTASFSVNLNAAAKKVVRSRGKLAITVKVTVTPATGAPFTVTQTVTLKR